MGQLPYEENPREVIVPAESVSTVLTGLESFAVYRIELTGLTVKGDGPSEVITAGNQCLASIWPVFGYHWWIKGRGRRTGTPGR